KDPGGDHWAVVVRAKGAPAWVQLTGTGPAGAWLKKDGELPDKVWAVLQQPDPDTDWAAWAKDLAKQRLRPLQEPLDGITHLVILPSPTLRGIPIEALTDRYTISYAPLGTVYAWLHEQRKDFGKGAGQLLALADPAFSAEQAKAAPAPADELALLRGK